MAADGITTSRRKILESGQRQSGQPSEALIPPRPFPELLRAIFAVSAQLDRERIPCEIGLQPLTQMVVAAWQFNMQVRFSPYEVRALMALDDVKRRVVLDEK